MDESRLKNNEAFLLVYMRHIDHKDENLIAKNILFTLNKISCEQDHMFAVNFVFKYIM